MGRCLGLTGLVGRPNLVAPSPLGVPGKLLRAGSFAFASMVLAVSAHCLAGGRVTWTTLVPSALGVLLLGAVLARRERSGRSLGRVVVGTQFVLHGTFVLPAMVSLTRAGSGRLSTSLLASVLFCHHGAPPISAAQVHRAAAGVDLSQLRPTAAVSSSLWAVLPGAIVMLVAHLVAAAVLAWWLRRGERALWRLSLRWLRVLRMRWRAHTRHVGEIVAAPGWFVADRAWARAPGRGPPLLRRVCRV